MSPTTTTPPPPPPAWPAPPLSVGAVDFRPQTPDSLPAGWGLVWADGADGEITAGIESGYGARYLRLSSYAG